MTYKILAAFLITSSAVAACKKGYTCKCEEFLNGEPTSTNSKTVGWGKISEEQAEYNCAAFETSHTIDTNTIYYECQLTPE